MSRKLLIAGVVAAAMIAGSGSAQATTIGGGPDFTGTDDGSVTQTNTSSGNAINCVSSAFELELATGGAGSVSSATFSSCAYGFMSATLTAQSLPWSASADWNGGSPTLTMARDIAFALFGCSWTVAGTVVGDLTDGSSQDGVSFTGAGPMPASDVTGWACGSSFANGDDWELDGTYILTGAGGSGSLTIAA